MQICETGYPDILKQHDIQKIFKYGIACYIKECQVMFEEEKVK